MIYAFHTETVQIAAASERAAAYLLTQAGRQFGEVRHEMIFPVAGGFTGRREKQSSDVFARATLANLCLDIAELSGDAGRGWPLKEIARSEAAYVASAKLPGRAGGWSYFPELPELPPDLDSLAAAVSLFSRAAPEHIALCQAPIEIVLAGASADGSIETWIIGPADDPSDCARMQWGIKNCWGTGADPDVLASFYNSLLLHAPDRYREIVRRGAAKVMSAQQTNGAWEATWYWGPAYGTGLAARLLRKAEIGEAARARAFGFLQRSQREDGAWGSPVPTPLETALSLWALHEADPGSSSVQMQRGCAALMEMQSADGSWPASPWIQMQIGRAAGKTIRVATYQSVTLTTAFCLKALLLQSSHDQLAASSTGT